MPLYIFHVSVNIGEENFGESLTIRQFFPTIFPCIVCHNVIYVCYVTNSLEVYIPVNPLTKEQFVATMQHNKITSDADTATRLFEVMVPDQKGV